MLKKKIRKIDQYSLELLRSGFRHSYINLHNEHLNLIKRLYSTKRDKFAIQLEFLQLLSLSSIFATLDQFFLKVFITVSNY